VGRTIRWFRCFFGRELPFMCQDVDFMTSCGSRGLTGDAGVDDGAGVKATQPRRWRRGRSSMAAFRRGQLRIYVCLVTWQIASVFVFS